MWSVSGKRGASGGRRNQPRASADSALNLFNTGVYAIRSTNETLRLVTRWIQANDGKAHDQAVINRMAYKDFVVSYPLYKDFWT